MTSTVGAAMGKSTSSVRATGAEGTSATYGQRLLAVSGHGSLLGQTSTALGKRIDTVPTQLRLLRMTLFVAMAGLIAVLVAGGVSASGSWSDIRDNSAPQVASATGLYFALNDLDAQLANRLMVGQTASFASQRSRASTIYEERREQASSYLSDLAGAADGDPAAEQQVADAISDLAEYEEHAGSALLLANQAGRPAGKADAKAVAEYTKASDLMSTQLLPEVDELVTSNNRDFEHTYHAARTTRAQIGGALILIGLLLLGLLLGLQRYLATYFHRVVNPGTAAATLVVVALLVAGLVQLYNQREHLSEARRDAFDSVVFLTRARALSYAANADESRYLLDRPNAAAYERDFFNTSQRIAHLDWANIDHYDEQLAFARYAFAEDAYIRFTGLFGEAFSNITFSGERQAAERVLSAYQVYQLDDRKIRALAASGKVAEAIKFCTSHAAGGSNYDFDAYDDALQNLININTRAFEKSSSDGAGSALTVPLGLSGGVFAAAGLVLLGLRPRLAEFR